MQCTKPLNSKYRNKKSHIIVRLSMLKSVTIILHISLRINLIVQEKYVTLYMSSITF